MDEPVSNGVAIDAEIDLDAGNSVNLIELASLPLHESEQPAHTAESASAFSWLDPHPIFVIVLVGAEEHPFGIQKDFLCAKSSYYAKFFADNPQQNIEHILRLPETPAEVFAYTQNFMFTGRVFPSLDRMPSYEVLIGVWKLGYRLGIDGLCEATLGAMSECRRITQHIPATPLLVQVWENTPEGSSIRKLLLSWAAEYMRSSASRTEFARSLPQSVLSELVVAMSSLDSALIVQAQPAPLLPAGVGVNENKRSVQYNKAAGDDSDDMYSTGPTAKKARHSDVVPIASSSAHSNGRVTPAGHKPPARVSLPAPAKTTASRRKSGANGGDHIFTTEQKVMFCADLLSRMLSGPGFWTRLVGPFREPVDPEVDGVPDYFTKVSRPMDLGTMKNKMDQGEYATDEDFLADMNQIFTNCYTYWSKKDPMWAACERLQKTFEEKYQHMHKWLAKMVMAEES